MLSDAKIRSAKPRERAYRLSDSQGLCILVQPSGGKLFQVRYRHEGKERTYSIGAYPTISLAEARGERDAVRRKLAHRVDPVESRRQDRQEQQLDKSFEAVARAWFAVWSVGKSERHAGYVMRRLEADVFPALGTTSVDAVTAPQMLGLLKRIDSRGAHDIAKRAHQMCGQIFRFAIAHGLAARNPSADFRPSDVVPTLAKQNFARIDGKELPALLQAMEIYSGTPVTRIALHLMSLTFVRTTELIEATWDEIDLEARRWDIPAARMKMGDPHIVPLSTQACLQLRLLHAITGKGKFLFPGDRNAERPMSNNTILKALERMGFKGRMTGHGFRGLASTLLHEQGFDHQHIELQLAHQQRNRVAAAYNHAKYLAQRAAMMQAWADFLDVTLKGRPHARRVAATRSARLHPTGSTQVRAS